MNYYNEIKERLVNNEIYEKIKDYSKERNRVITYFEIGKLLNEAGKHYGENIIGEYSKKLVIEVGRKYNKRTLFRMKQLYNTFSNEKVSALLTQLTWTHCLELMTLKNLDEINYYALNVIKYNQNYRQLHDRIKSNEYERLPEETKIKLYNKEKSNIKDLIKNPIMIKNRNNEIVSEKVLQRLILEDIPSFLQELGNGFTFIKNEYKIKLGNTYNYIDENLRKINQDKTKGIIICKKDNKYVIEYCSDERIISRTYELI